ncbi:hypothetical protein LP420_10530 [Massilia sp. B-10]|nr:hypothetical protein LP420_10530 [Massilia sp. B-10]
MRAEAIGQQPRSGLQMNSRIRTWWTHVRFESTSFLMMPAVMGGVLVNGPCHHTLKILHNLFYLNAFDTNLARLSGLCMGLSVSAMILALATHKEFRRRGLQEKMLLAFILSAPVIIGVLNWSKA